MVIAVLYNTNEELLKFKSAFSDLLVEEKPKSQMATYDGIGDVRFCVCNVDDVIQAFHSTPVVGYFVTGNSLYCGRALRYVASRVRGNMDSADYIEQIRKLQSELDAVRLEMEDYKVKWERLMQFKDAPRLPLRGRTDELTTVGWDEKEDWK